MVLSEAEGRTLIKTDGFVCLIPGGKCVYTDYTLNHVVIITSLAGERDMENFILRHSLFGVGHWFLRAPDTSNTR